MSRSLWKRALFGMAGVGLSGALIVMHSQAQTPVELPPAAASKAERTVTLYENGKSLRCRLVHTWKLPDGSTAHQLAALSDGETITLIEEGTTTRVDGKEARPTRIYHWGPGSTTPPPGVPAFPAAEPTTVIIGNNSPSKLPDVTTIPVTSGPRVVDVPTNPAAKPETIVNNGGPRMVETPKFQPSAAAPVVSAPSAPVSAGTTPGSGAPIIVDAPTGNGRGDRLGSRLFQGKVAKAQAGSDCPTCNGTCGPNSGCSACGSGVGGSVAPPLVGAPASVQPVTPSQPTTPRRTLFGVKNGNVPTAAPPIASAGTNPAGENIIMVTDPSNGQPAMPIVAAPKTETPRGPLMQRLFNKPGEGTPIAEPKPVLESVREPFSTAMDPSLKKEVRKPVMPRIDTPPPMVAEFPQPPSDKDAKPSEKRDWRMSWGRNDNSKGEVPGQSTVEKAKFPLASVTEKSKTDPLLNPDRTVKPAPDLPQTAGKQPLPSGIGSVVAAGGPANGQPAFIPVPIATVPNVTRQPMPPPVQLPGGPPGPPSVNMPTPPNNPWANNAFTAPVAAPGQAPAMVNAFVTPPPPPVQQPSMPGNAFDLQRQQQQQQMQQAYYPQPGYYPQAAYYPQAQPGYYPMPQPSYAHQTAYQPQAGYPVAPVGYQMPAPQANVAANPAMDRRTGQPETQAVAQLLQTLTDSPFPAQREWAAQTLATYDHRNHPQVIQALCTAARQDPAGSVRSGCVYSLSRLGLQTEAVLSTLQALRADSDPRVRQEVEEAHQRLGVK